MATKENKLLNLLNNSKSSGRKSIETKVPIASEMYIPNHSGNHGNLIADSICIESYQFPNTSEIFGTVKPSISGLTTAQGEAAVTSINIKDHFQQNLIEIKSQNGGMDQPNILINKTGSNSPTLKISGSLEVTGTSQLTGTTTMGDYDGSWTDGTKSIDMSTQSLASGTITVPFLSGDGTLSSLGIENYLFVRNDANATIICANTTLAKNVQIVNDTTLNQATFSTTGLTNGFVFNNKASFSGDVTLTGELKGSRVILTGGQQSIAAGTTSGYYRYGLAIGTTANGFVMPRAGSIVGISGLVTATGHSVTGDMTFEIRKNNTVVLSGAVSVTGNNTFTITGTQARGTDTFVAGDIINLSWQNAGTYTKESSTITAEIQFDT